MSGEKSLLNGAFPVRRAMVPDLFMFRQKEKKE